MPRSLALAFALRTTLTGVAPRAGRPRRGPTRWSSTTISPGAPEFVRVFLQLNDTNLEPLVAEWHGVYHS